MTGCPGPRPGRKELGRRIEQPEHAADDEEEHAVGSRQAAIMPATPVR